MSHTLVLTQAAELENILVVSGFLVLDQGRLVREDSVAVVAERDSLLFPFLLFSDHYRPAGEGSG